MTSGSRGSGRGGGGETTADWRARAPFTQHKGSRASPGRAARSPPGCAPAAGCAPAVEPLAPAGPPRGFALGELPVELWAPPSRGCQPEEGARGKVMNSIISHSPPPRGSSGEDLCVVVNVAFFFLPFPASSQL